MYILLSLSVDSADGPVDDPVDGPADGPADGRHACVLHSLSSVVGVGHAVPP